MKNSIIYKRRNCRACESDKLDLFFSLKPSPIGDEFVSRDKLGINQKKYPIDLYMCRDCNLFQLIDVISPEVLYGNYIYVSESSVGLKNHFNSFSKSIIQDLNLKKDSLGSISAISEEIASKVIEKISGEPMNQSSIKAAILESTKKSLGKYL